MATLNKLFIVMYPDVTSQTTKEWERLNIYRQSLRIAASEDVKAYAKQRLYPLWNV